MNQLTDVENQLTDVEKRILHKYGWRFLNENYIYIPDDYDGCMAYGISNIRIILEKIQQKHKTDDNEIVAGRTPSII